MDTIIQGIAEAFRLIVSCDTEIYEIVGLSLYVSLTSVIISAILGIPFGMFLGSCRFYGKGVIVRVIYTLMSLPPVIAGLAVFLILMRRGPLGSLQLNYTVPAMIIAQILLVTPIITGLTYSIARDKSSIVSSLGFTLGAGRIQRFMLLCSEMRAGIITAVISGFGRAISEVGAVMIVGGNIKGKTRVMTTYISELKGMGNFSRAIAVGIILLVISFIINASLYHFQERQAR